MTILEFSFEYVGSQANILKSKRKSSIYSQVESLVSSLLVMSLNMWEVKAFEFCQSGYSSQSGQSGLPGLSSQSGLSGPSGQSGQSGQPGQSGQSGLSGLSGLSGSIFSSRIGSAFID